MKNMYAIVFFLVVITGTSSVSCVSSNNDEEIFMVVDERTSTMQTNMGIKDDNPFQIGKFKLKDGRTFTLMRPLNKEANCVYTGETCGALDWCCGSLVCNDPFSGKCYDPSASCLSSGTLCLPYSTPCCPPSFCAPTTASYVPVPVFKCV